VVVVYGVYARPILPQNDAAGYETRGMTKCTVAVPCLAAPRHTAQRRTSQVGKRSFTAKNMIQRFFFFLRDLPIYLRHKLCMVLVC
jgi:hypothetical protein